jgi:hypothetical protein
MPPAPTDLLNEEVREVRESHLRLAARMDSLEVGVRDMREEFVKFRARINTIIAIMGAAAAILVGSAGMIWTGFASVQRELGRTEATVSGLDKRFDDLNRRFDETNRRFDELRSIGDRLGQVAEGLARLQGRGSIGKGRHRPLKASRIAGRSSTAGLARRNRLISPRPRVG